MSLNNDSYREGSTRPIRSLCERRALYVGRLANTTFALSHAAWPRLWGLGVAYDLVRFEAERVADEAGVPPTRISFVAALTPLETALRTQTATRFLVEEPR